MAVSQMRVQLVVAVLGFYNRNRLNDFDLVVPRGVLMAVLQIDRSLKALDQHIPKVFGSALLTQVLVLASA